MPQQEVFVVSNSIYNDRTYAGQTVLTYRVQYPQFTAYTPMASLQRINTYYRQQALYLAQTIQTTYYADAVADFEDRRRRNEPFSPFEFLRTFEITHGQNCIISLYLDEYQYTGGANGTTTRTSDTWDARTGQQLSLATLFRANTSYTGVLEAIIVAEIARRNAQQGNLYFDNSAELVREYFNPERFYLTPETLVIYFQAGEIAPHATGIPTFPIPYAPLGITVPGC